MLSHGSRTVANGDMVTMTLIQGVVNAFVMFLARVIAFAVAQFMSRDRDDNEGMSYGILLPHCSSCARCSWCSARSSSPWFSRRREFRADAGGAQIGGRERMIGALEAYSARWRSGIRARRSGQHSKISNPNGLMRFFMTHPPLEERIARLHARPPERGRRR